MAAAFDRVEVTNIDDLKPGDAVIFNLESNTQEGIVTVVSPHRADKQLGLVDVVNYQQTPKGITTVIEKAMFFDLHKHTIIQKAYVNSFDATTVIARARSRIDERRYDSKENSNRHFVEWAKVGYESNLLVVSPHFSSEHQLVNLYNAYSWFDIERGSIIDFLYYGIRHQGVVTHVDKENSQVKVIHYGTNHIFATRTVIRDTIHIDFKTQLIRIYRCNQSDKCNKPNDVATKAEKRLGEQKWNVFWLRSWSFCLQCLFN
ncbi:hypothetical protein DPMN_063511 [Dreissena polymorpha]|uniref:Uncharacterized protein n=1 Tax=Dreissena polymorpha TaxID=45954 RepID=A0A9D4CAN2_DREPO|nr:hypothetical protein DPMN_063511 [Dreissena polymorpha]